MPDCGLGCDSPFQQSVGVSLKNAVYDFASLQAGHGNPANPVTHLSLEGMTLLVYTTPWCSDCREAKRFLIQHGIPFTEIDIETTPGAAQEVVARTGKRAIPQFVIDGRWVQPYQPQQGFLYEEMAKLLGIEQHDQAATEKIHAKGPRS